MTSNSKGTVMAKKEYEKIGGGQFGIYRPKPKKTFDWDALVGVIFLIFILVAVLGSCAG